MNLSPRSAVGKRDIALTTLIDLLVQIVFVFTLVMVASGVMDGFIAPEAWSKLVQEFSIPTGTPEEQAAAIKQKMAEIALARAKLEQEVNSLKGERTAMRARLTELDLKVAELSKKLGAPGYPPCRAPDFSEQTVARIRINRVGQIEVQELPVSMRLDGVGSALISRGASSHGANRESNSRQLVSIQPL
jgi:hypothetical protein